MSVSARARRRQERAWLQWPVRHRPFASPTPCRGIGAPISPIPLPRRSSASAASILNRHLPHQPGSSARILPPLSLRSGSAPASNIGSPVKLASPCLLPFLHGKPAACLSPAAIPSGSRSPSYHRYPLTFIVPPSIHRRHGPSRPRPRRPSAQRTGTGLCRGLGACSLPDLAPPKPVPLPHQTASGASLRFAPAPWSLGDLQGDPRIRTSTYSTAISRSTRPPARLPATKAD